MAEDASPTVGNVRYFLFNVVKNEMSHIWNYPKNLEKLKNEADKLSGMKGRLQQQIDLAESRGEVLVEGITDWVEKAGIAILDAKNIIDEDAEAKKTSFIIRLSVSFCTLYQHSKMAAQKTSFLMQHHEDGKNFETCVSHPARNPGYVDLYQRKNLTNIDSQKLTLKKIIGAIEDDEIQIVGIVGLGGVGKTTLASEVAVAEEMKNKLDYVELIAVSQTVNTEVIKEKVKVAAKRIMNNEKVLIILDDVWEELKLNELGIPCGSGHMNCKILLTSRNRDVCEKMNAQKIIPIRTLPDKEAWTLFERVVGLNEWDNRLQQVALEIVKECGGLPLFVQVVGKALKGKNINRWEAALHQLKTPVNGVATCKYEGLRQLKLSYDYLEDEVAKSCFLLCSMFPEDCSIGLKRVTYYALALGILNNPRSIQDAKVKVLWAVDSLKSSFLLQSVEKFNINRVSQEGEDEEFKMHDLVRDMALFVTSEGDDKFFVLTGKDLTEWLPRNDSIKDYKKISLMGTRIRKLPDIKLELPHLDTFLVQDNYRLSVVPDEFFLGIKKVKVLDLSRNAISSLPQSLKYLINLRTLYLSGNSSLCEISILGELTFLEILMLRGTGITHIPKEIGNLTNLRVLDVDYCPGLFWVTPGVISKLIWLEEFYIGMEEGDCRFLAELRRLKLLKVLHLKVPSLHGIPEDFHFETLMEFHIKDNVVWLNYTHGCKLILEISQRSYPLTRPIIKLIQASEKLHMWQIKGLDNLLQVVYQAGFEKLRYIDLWDCENVTCFVKTSFQGELGQRRSNVKFFSQVETINLRTLGSLKLLWGSPHQYINFSNLMKIYIRVCPSLLELFPLSVAQGLVKLRELYILNCERLVVVISAGDEQTIGSEIEQTSEISEIELVVTDIVFHKLTTIYLSALPKLESFCHDYSIFKYPALKNISVEDCPSMKRWSYGENHIPNIKFDHEEKRCSNINDYIEAHLEIDNGELRMRDWCRDDTKDEIIEGGINAVVF